MKDTVSGLQVWQRIFDSVEGIAQRIAVGILVSIGDIQRFVVPSEPRRKKRTISKVKAFCGVHVMAGGKYQDVLPEHSFPRRRGGQLSNWSPLARQSLYLFMDQCNRRPSSIWGKKVLEYKEKLRLAHPEPVEVNVNGNGKTIKKYTPGHIHKIALWKTATKFVEWMASEWLRVEGVSFE